MELIVSPEVKESGIKACMALVKGAAVSNKSNPLEKRKKEVIERLQSKDIGADSILSGYREFYEKAGLEGFVPPAQHLLALIQKNGRLPNINTVVDCYNLVSAQTSLSIGAHDTAFIKGNVIFRVTDGSERYTPLGETEPLKILPGEYACMDEEKILCRMDVKQCAETRITKQTGEFIVYVQGNRYTGYSYLLEGLQEVCGLIRDICGGSFEVIPEKG
jgi:DNA/RNA-binding domain of Phe-tRNA-synthetase-like protein